MNKQELYEGLKTNDLDGLVEKRSDICKERYLVGRPYVKSGT